MTPIYEVDTRHDERVLKAFIGFNTEMKASHAVFRLILLGICLFTMAYIAREYRVLSIVFAALGVLFVASAFGRKSLGVMKLKKVDPLYKNQTQIHMVFGHSGFVISTDETRNYKYGEIQGLYGDDNFFFMHTDDDELMVIPKADFTSGSAADFYHFIMDKTGKDILPVNQSFKEKYQQELVRAKSVQKERKEQIEANKASKKKK